MELLRPEVDAVLELLLGGRPIDQLAFVVEDLPSIVKNWSRIRGGEWMVYTYNPDNIPELEYHGRRGTFSMRLAMHGGAPQLEFIQAIDGPSIYLDWIKERGHGFHHIGYFMPSLNDAVESLAAVGMQPIMTGEGYGAEGDGGFAYFDFVDTLGVVIEFIEVPTIRRPSESLLAS